MLWVGQGAKLDSLGLWVLIPDCSSLRVVHGSFDNQIWKLQQTSTAFPFSKAQKLTLGQGKQGQQGWWQNKPPLYAKHHVLERIGWYLWGKKPFRSVLRLP